MHNAERDLIARTLITCLSPPFLQIPILRIGSVNDNPLHGEARQHA